MKLTDVIRRPLITEKTSIQREDGRTIVFHVARKKNNRNATAPELALDHKATLETWGSRFIPKVFGERHYLAVRLRVELLTDQRRVLLRIVQRR